MQTIHNSLNPAFLVKEKSQSIFSRFIAWCTDQEKYRFGWVATIIAIHGCILAPITVLAIALGGNQMTFWAVAIGAMAMALVSNLAAMPTKITIPVFFFSVLLDVVLIVSSLVIAFQ